LELTFISGSLIEGNLLYWENGENGIGESQEKRLVALLRAAALWKRNWRELEKGTLRMLADAALKNVNRDPRTIE
jgi:hypothetical protein